MPSIPFEKIIQGPTFCFYIGEEQKAMVIHTALVAEQSAALRSLVNGSMKEARDGSTKWEDVTIETFVAFAEYVYTGNYNLLSLNKPKTSTEISAEGKGAPSLASRTPIFVEAVPAEEIPPDEIPTGAIPPEESVYGDIREIKQEDLPVHGWGSWGSWDYEPSKKKVHKKPKMRSQQPSYHSRFHDLSYPLPLVPPRFSEVPNHPNSSAAEDFTPVVLGHAHLYAFADYWGIEPLKAIALNKLHKVLCNNTRHKARCEDVVELVRYTYDNTPSRKQRDPLREMVVQYLVFEAKEIASSEQCLELVGKGGAFAKDLTGLTIAHLKETLQ